MSENLPAEQNAQDAPDRPDPGTYWAATRDLTRHWPKLEEGQMVLVLPSDDAGRVRYATGDSTTSVDVDDFLDRFEFVPDGAQKRQGEIARLMREVTEAEVETEGLEQKLRAFNPHVSDEGKLEGAGTDLVPTQGAASPEIAKKAIADVRNQVARHKKDMLAKQERIKALMEEQQALIKAKVGDLTEMVRAAEEAIWTINLYLGKDEQIVRLSEGEPAPADEKIVMRQLVLYMDEESAIAADEGGIDVRNIEAFDEWVTEPEHRQQVIPEEKAVVALKVRRSEKDYGDPWLTSRMKQANEHTYFLMRNGENLYRIDTELEVGKTLLPLEDEVEELFWTERWDHDRKEKIREPLRPGSREYMKAMKKADAKHRHFMRIALFLQGLLDRTPVFQPLPAPRINILDPAEQQKYVRLIFDAEPKRHIGTGRPPFREWQTEINGQLDVGQRVVGAFQSYAYGITDQDERRHRLHPSNAEPPSSSEIYTIEDRDGDTLIIRYERTSSLDQIYDPYEGFRQPKNRASCKLYRDDRFILNFDAAGTEDMEYYLTSRLNRHAYMYMVPVLKRAIWLKREEAEEEAPFIDLLAGEIMKEHSADGKEAREALTDLVPWWKFKNKTHRALTSEDTKAIRMITKEFGLRKKREDEREDIEPEPLIQAVTEAYPDVLYIAHKKGPRYIALVPHNDETVFVREQEWSVGRGSPKRLSEKEWRTVTSRRQRWETVYTSARWEDWTKDVRARAHLTDPEREELVRAALERAPHFCEKLRTWFSTYHSGSAVCRPLVVLIDEEQELRIFLQYSRPSIPKRLISGNIQEPGFGLVRIGWNRTRDGVEPAFERPQSVTFHRYWGTDNRYNHGGVGERTILFQDDEALAAFDADLAAAKEAEARGKELGATVRKIVSKVRSVVAENIEREASETYVAEHGDPELWDENKKQLDLSPPQMDSVRRAAVSIVEAGVDPEGWTVGRLLDEAKAFGFEAKEDDRDREVIPLDYIIGLTGAGG